MTDERQWYAELAGESRGPFSNPEIRALVQKGQLTSESLVWREGMPDWALLDAVPELAVVVMPRAAEHLPGMPRPVQEPQVGVGPSDSARPRARGAASPAQRGQGAPPRGGAQHPLPWAKKAGAIAGACALVGILVWLVVRATRAPSTPEEAFESFRQAMLNEDFGTMWDCMSKTTQEQEGRMFKKLERIGSADAEEFKKEVWVAPDEFAKLSPREKFVKCAKSATAKEAQAMKDKVNEIMRSSKVTNCKIEGNKATLTVKNGDIEHNVSLIKEGDEWKVDLGLTFMLAVARSAERECANSLKQLGLYINLWVSKFGNESKYPGPGRRLLFDLYNIPNQETALMQGTYGLLVCKAAGTPVPTARQVAAEDPLCTSYECTNDMLDDTCPTDKPIIWDNRPVHAGGRNVLFFDRSVRLVDETEFKKLQDWEQERRKTRESQRKSVVDWHKEYEQRRKEEEERRAKEQEQRRQQEEEWRKQEEARRAQEEEQRRQLEEEARRKREEQEKARQQELEKIVTAFAGVSFEKKTASNRVGTLKGIEILNAKAAVDAQKVDASWAEDVFEQKNTFVLAKISFTLVGEKEANIDTQYFELVLEDGSSLSPAKVAGNQVRTIRKNHSFETTLFYVLRPLAGVKPKSLLFRVSKSGTLDLRLPIKF